MFLFGVRIVLTRGREWRVSEWITEQKLENVCVYLNRSILYLYKTSQFTGINSNPMGEIYLNDKNVFDCDV